MNAQGTAVVCGFSQGLTDGHLGGTKNFHNGAGGTYDCIALMSYAWGDDQMHLAPYEKDKPIYYAFTHCPVAKFAKKHDLPEIMPALCNPDYGK